MNEVLSLRPGDFVNLAEYIPTIETEVRYFTENNFTGAPVSGYGAPLVLLTEAAAKALKRAQESILPRGYTLRVYDGYRPRRADLCFSRWCVLPEDAAAKARYYPMCGKREIFERGYLQLPSDNSRGSAVDLTLVDCATGRPLDMGSTFNYFEEASENDFEDLLPEQGKNRMMLKYLMMSCGFVPHKKAWWHYRLRYEPYPDTYFDFEII
ncbi:MAG: M15 family metallopeptidase [Eubacterium sp.]|nr:M15 family metallopeptidase [Eubacterium sp.]